MSLQAELLIANHLKTAVLKNKAVQIIAACIGFLLVFGIATAWISFENQNASAAKFQKESREDWLNNPDKNPHRMAHYGNFAFRKTEPLSVFEFGMTTYFGNIIFLEAHKQNSANFSEAGLSNSLVRFGAISVAMIWQILFPLLLIFIGFNAVSSERENGTLKLILSQGVQWKPLLIGKIIGVIKVLLLFFVPTVLVIGMIWLLLQRTTISFDNSIRFISFIGFHFIYLVVFSLIIVLISAVSTTSKKALIVLIGLWLLLTVILPKLTQSLGAYLYESPSKIGFQQAIEKDILKVGDSHNPDDVYFKAIKDSLLLAHKVDSVQQLPFNYSGYIMTEGEKISSSIYNKHLDDLLKIYEQQNQFSRVVSYFNPYISIKNLSMALTHTDYNSFIDFQKQAENYRYEMTQKMNALQIKHISNYKPKKGEKPQVIDKKYWHHLDEFDYQTKPLSAVLKAELPSIISILVWLVLLFFAIQMGSKKLKAI